jgi:hypothetical protein
MQMNTTTDRGPSCLARMLDVRTYVLAARQGMARADAGGALFMVGAFAVIALVLLPIWITFDLNSTWDFTTGLRAAAEPVVYEVTGGAEDLLQLSVGALLAGIIFTGFTLLPSLFELAFPTVNHPLLNLILLCSIVFDFVTDWGKSAELVASWTDNRTLAFFYTIGVCAFVSVFVQALLICCITVIVYGVLQILSGGARRVEVAVVEQR